jgi:hypothetical protein
MKLMRRHLAPYTLIFAGFFLSACRHQQISVRDMAQQQTELSEAQSCRQFVQDFYNSYFDGLNAEIASRNTTPVEEQIIQQRPAVLAPELSQMLAADREAQKEAPGDIVGLDFDPFLNAQDWEGKYWVNSVNLEDGVCRASVWGIDAGKKKPVVEPVLKSLNNSWVFTDFFYPEGKQHGDASLVGTLTDLRMVREQTKNKRPHK